MMFILFVDCLLKGVKCLRNYIQKVTIKLKQKTPQSFFAGHYERLDFAWLTEVGNELQRLVSRSLSDILITWILHCLFLCSRKRFAVCLNSIKKSLRYWTQTVICFYIRSAFKIKSLYSLYQGLTS